MSRDINKFIRPDLWGLVACDAAAIGLHLGISCVDRTAAEQSAYYAQSRKPLDEVNLLRRAAGLPFITQQQNARAVTWVTTSQHQPDDQGFSRAIDFFIVNHGAAVWDVKADVNADQLPDYQQVAAIAKKYGFRCGIDFHDPCHIELPVREIAK